MNSRSGSPKVGKTGRIVRGVGGVRGGELEFQRVSESEEKIQIQVGENGSREV